MKRKIKRLLYTNKVRVVIYLLLIVFFLVSFTFFTISLLKLNGIETTIRIIILACLIIYLIYYIYKAYYYMVNKNKVRYSLLSFLTFLISIILLVVIYYMNIVYGTIDNLGEKETSLYTGYLISLNKDTDIKEVGMIKNTKDIEGYVIANEIINENNLDYEIRDYDNYDDMLYDLYNEDIDGAFVQSNYLTYFGEEELFANISSDTKVVYKKSKKDANTNVIASNNKTLSKPFTILLMGVDATENNIEEASSFNGDTLMLISFNPQTLNAMIFSIPRDLYVPIACRNGAKAKINSSAAGGVSCVIDTIKDLTDIDIDYYAKINFKGVVDLVEALDGIDVEVTYPFCEQDSHRNFTNQICLKAGYQHLNGEQTLAYARHRHSLPTGDLQRIQNQQLIVEALSQKLISLKTVTDFRDILAAISNNITTNLTRDQILSSYNILKDMVINVISDKEALGVEKAYLEVYDKRIYNPNSGTYSATLGYYENSLDDILKKMKMNLGKEKNEVIKEFAFDANITYEPKVAGKDLKTEVDNATIPNFVGKTLSEVTAWGIEHNVTISSEYVDITNEHYNSEIGVGLVGNQSISGGTSLTNINSLIVYINTVTE